MRCLDVGVLDSTHDEAQVNLHPKCLGVGLSLQDINDLAVVSSAHHHEKVDLSHQEVVQLLASSDQLILGRTQRGRSDKCGVYPLQITDVFKLQFSLTSRSCKASLVTNHQKPVDIPTCRCRHHAALCSVIHEEDTKGGGSITVNRRNDLESVVVPIRGSITVTITYIHTCDIHT